MKGLKLRGPVSSGKGTKGPRSPHTPSHAPNIKHSAFQSSGRDPDGGRGVILPGSPSELGQPQDSPLWVLGPPRPPSLNPGVDAPAQQYSGDQASPLPHIRLLHYQPGARWGGGGDPEPTSWKGRKTEAGTGSTFGSLCFSSSLSTSSRPGTQGGWDRAGVEELGEGASGALPGRGGGGAWSPLA